MKAVVLASGSKGNVAYVESESTRILIDIGKSCAYIERKLESINVDPKTIDAILITHTHTDHICGIKTFYNKYKPTIYITPKMALDLENILDEFKCSYYKEETVINDITVDVIKTSHDASDSVGFIINNELVYITDTGYLNDRYIPKLRNKKAYIIESNHDIEMLYSGSYPYHLKKRIASDSGHLSNKDTSKYLSKVMGADTKHIILAHLSEENNTKEKAIETLSSVIDIDNGVSLIVAEQDERTQVIEI